MQKIQNLNLREKKINETSISKIGWNFFPSQWFYKWIPILLPCNVCGKVGNHKHEPRSIHRNCCATQYTSTVDRSWISRFYFSVYILLFTKKKKQQQIYTHIVYKYKVNEKEKIFQRSVLIFSSFLSFSSTYSLLALFHS